MIRSFRPSGIARYFSAAFLLVWLAGWTVGEAGALFALGAILSGMAGLFPDRIPEWIAHPASSVAVLLMTLFLIVWLTFWTIGGIATWTHLIRSLWGEDTIALTPEGIELVRRGGPFRRRRVFDRAFIRRIRVRPHDKAVVIEAPGTHVLTTLGTPVERQEAADWLIRSLSLPDAATPPEKWKVSEDADCTRLMKGTLFRREWVVRRGELTFRANNLFWKSERAFMNARLEVTHTTDSDNDSWYRLIVFDGESRKTLHSQMNDAAEAVDLGHWLSARTGFPLSLPAGLRQ